MAHERHIRGRRRSALGRAAAAGIGMAVVLGLSACAPAASPPDSKPSTHLTTVPRPTPTATMSDVPLGQAGAKDIIVTVYAGTQFKAGHGCGCKLKDDSTDELFPAGTPVVLLRISLVGVPSPHQESNTQDLTGISVADTKFEGRPEKAVLDTKDGAADAAQLNLPWLPQGLFPGKHAWTIQNSRLAVFVAAWYVPQGVDTLDVTVNIPSQGGPVVIPVTLPAPVLDLIAGSQK